jgi:hypothetical protein
LVRKRISFSPYRYFVGYFSEEIITQLNFGKNPKSDSKFHGDSSVGRLIAAYADVGHDATAKLKNVSQSILSETGSEVNS